MSRLRADQENVAKEAFKREIKIRRAYCDMTQRELADQVGVVPSVMSTLLANPDKISTGRLRKIIQALALDPAIILALLGYSSKEIKRFREN